MTKANNSQHR